MIICAEKINFLISRSYTRLDTITFHWRCLSDKLDLKNNLENYREQNPVDISVNGNEKLVFSSYESYYITPL